MIRRPPRATRVPYTTLCRSAGVLPEQGADLVGRSAQEFHPEVAHAQGPHARQVLRRGLGHRVEARRRSRRLRPPRSEEHTSELQSRQYLVCRLLLETNLTLL